MLRSQLLELAQGYDAYLANRRVNKFHPIHKLLHEAVQPNIELRSNSCLPVTPFRDLLDRLNLENFKVPILIVPFSH